MIKGIKGRISLTGFKLTTAAVIFINKGLYDDNLIFNGDFVPLSIGDKMLQVVGCDSVYYAIWDGYDGRLRSYDDILFHSGLEDINFWQGVLLKGKFGNYIRVYGDAPFLGLAFFYR